MARPASSAFSILLLLALPAAAQVKRVVVIKADGLPESLIERYAREPAGPGREGRSRLPWIQHVFRENGAWLENFYVRGISLSAPSWSMLDTGRHLEIHANAEWDRYTLRVRDYLNFFPFYLGYAMSKEVDMAGVRLLDEQGIPLLIDRFPYAQRFQGFQLYQRGVRWTTLEGSLKRSVHRSPKELFDEWQTGFSMSGSVNDQTERELILKLKDPQIRYLDFFTGEFDHVGHLTPDRVAQLHAIESIDALVGRVWSAIQQSPLADSTALVLISDHGMNTSEGIYSQGYNLLDWFNSAAGGAHHVLTNRHPMTEFKLKGLDPFVSDVITPSRDATYLAGASNYPTAVMELDGNEKAAIGLRNNSLNILHILLDQLTRKRLAGRVRAAALEAFFAEIERVRPAWQRDLDELTEELAVLQRDIANVQKEIESQPGKWSAAQRSDGLDKEARRSVSRLEDWRTEALEYNRYKTILTRLLSVTPADFDPGRFRMEDMIPPRSLGPENSIYDLQHYVTGPAPGGLVVNADGNLDFGRSFQTINYFEALGSLSVRNNVQKGVGPKPVDFIAVRAGDGVWLWGGEDRQALILRGPQGLRYVPVSYLTLDRDGNLDYQQAEFRPGLPLQLFEDPQLLAPEDWLREWHTEQEWLGAIHQTKYSNAIIGLAEQLLETTLPASASLRERFQERQRRLRHTDLLVLASDHWNFNVRGFNPGGNHGSFFRESTHSVFLIAGGKDTGIRRGARIQEPYDSLSFVPTILSLMGQAEPDLPGPVIPLQ